jgi:SAM-dependent methyltransferase
MWRQLRSLSRRVSKEGVPATACYATERLTNALRNRSMLPPNTVEENLKQWTRFDWSAKGEEWTPFPEWKESLVKHVLEPNIPLGSRILEIGPGGGRWTEFLVQRGTQVLAVDLTPRCIDICRERFTHCNNISFFVNDGNDLSFITPGSIDRVWSFDVFVHIQSQDVRTYMRQLAAILVDGGRGIIHHAGDGTRARGWRSDMTSGRMGEFCDEFGLTLVSQFSSWDEGRIGIDPASPKSGTDVITVFEKACA